MHVCAQQQILYCHCPGHTVMLQVGVIDSILANANNWNLNAVAQVSLPELQAKRHQLQLVCPSFFSRICGLISKTNYDIQTLLISKSIQANE